MASSDCVKKRLGEGRKRKKKQKLLKDNCVCLGILGSDACLDKLQWSVSSAGTIDCERMVAKEANDEVHRYTKMRRKKKNPEPYPQC